MGEGENLERDFSRWRGYVQTVRGPSPSCVVLFIPFDIGRRSLPIIGRRRRRVYVHVALSRGPLPLFSISYAV
jgi:hypothetical protein